MDSRFDLEKFSALQNDAYEIEALSEFLEQESRRYSKRLSQEDEAKII